MTKAHYLVALGVAFASAFAQSPPAKLKSPAGPAFDVVSIKLSARSPVKLGPGSAQVFPSVNSGRWRDGNVTVSQLVEYAYNLHCCDVTVVAGSSQLSQWVGKTTFAITATVAERTVPDGQLRAMLRHMLEVQFQLRTHAAVKTMPAYVLEVASGGPKLRPAAPCEPNGDPSDMPGAVPRCGLGGRPTENAGERLGAFRSFSMAQLASYWESSFFVIDRRPILDQTGLKGKYDFNLRVDTTGLVDAASHPERFHDAIAGAVKALAAQDGLKLDLFHTVKMPVPVRVIDRAVIPKN